jgi:glutathione synthase/RimK-type ligase-like ATP-grasp enzyme
MKKRLALITYSGLPHGAESERLMLPYLAAAGVETEIIDWRSSDCGFSKFDLIVLRSCWDYHLRAVEFINWLQRTAQATRVLNAVDTVLWNHNKFYLREVAALGIEIVPTIFVSHAKELSAEVATTIRSWKNKNIVVKPAISASAHNTRLMDGAQWSADQEVIRIMKGPFLVQPFIPEIQDEGEISFVYIDGRFSHAALKRPAAGDFRVQKEHGGSAELFHPNANLLAQADQIAAIVPQVRNSLYCRIDAVARDGKLVLMELELIEPELFLSLAEGAAEKFADAIVRRLK